MIIQRLTLVNFRTFYGTQIIDFSENTKKNVTLIHAENGVGKSTILSSILWCFYERVIDGFSQPDDLLNHEASDEKISDFSVELEFEHDGKHYAVIRQGHAKKGGGYTSAVKAFSIVEGNRKPITNAFNFINSVVPSSMADYFFFHGEGSIAAKGKNIRQAIRDILGFELAETAISDLKAIESSVRGEIRQKTKDKNLQEIQDKLETYQSRFNEALDDLKELEPLQSVHISKINELVSKLRDQPDVSKIQFKREAEQRQLKRYETQYKEWLGQETKYISEFGWALMAEGLAQESTDFIDESEIRGRIPSPYNETFIEDVLSRKTCICGAKLEPGSESYHRIQAMLAKSGNAELYNRVSKARSRIKEISIAVKKAPDEWKRIQRNIQSNQVLVAESEQKIAELKAQIDSCNIEEITRIENELQKFESEQKKISERIGALKQQIGLYASEIKKLKLEESLAISRDAGLKKQNHKLEFVQDIVLFLSKQLEGAEEKALDVIVRGVNDTLRAIARKAYTVEFDEDFRSLLLRKSDGRIVGESTGERLLLNFAFISTLIQFCRDRQRDPTQFLVAGAIAPFIIDAPFGELDVTYKAATAKFLPTKSQQVVLLLSSSHWSGVKEVLAPYVAKNAEYYLQSENRDPGKQSPKDKISIRGRDVEQSKYKCDRDMSRVMEVDW